MAKDPAFLFYPGDWQGGTMYLTQEQKGCYVDLLVLQFNVGKFTLAQAKQVLSICFAVAWPMLEQKFKTDGMYFWNERLRLEIEKRKNFSNSRRENALGQKNKPKNKEAYAQHMENEVINENVNKDRNGIENFLIPKMSKIFVQYNPNYPANKTKDSHSLFSIAKFFCEQAKLQGSPEKHLDKICEAWESVSESISKDNFYCQKSLSTISNHIQEIIQKLLHGKATNGKSKPGSIERAREFDKLFAGRYGNRGSATN